MEHADSLRRDGDLRHSRRGYERNSIRVFSPARIHLYLDGQQAATNGAPGVLYDGQPVRIGVHSEGISAPFDGVIDEVALFNTPLAVEDVQAIMTDGLQEATGLLSVDPAGKLATTWGDLRR